METENKRMQQLHGPWSKFDPQRLLVAELAVVTSGDPNSDTGRSLYICFEPGVVKRIVSYEDLENEFAAAADEIRALFQSDLQLAMEAANSAANNAEAARKAAADAAKRANDAAEACEGLTDNTRVTALEQKMQQVISVLANVLSTE